MSSTGTPALYRAPTKAPTLVPTTKSTGTFSRSRNLSTPMWARPRAPPPPSTRATRGRRAGGRPRNLFHSASTKKVSCSAAVMPAAGAWEKAGAAA